MRENNCTECPYYGSDYDSYIGDGDVWCECGCADDWGCVEGCSYPLIIRHILAIKEKIKMDIYDKQAEKAWMKEEECRYNERVRLGMTEEEYDQYASDNMMK